MKSCKIVVAHPYQQHSFRTASAVKKMGCLYAYVTTVYDKKKSITSFAKKILRGDNLKRANGRRCSAINDVEVIQFCELKSLFLLLLHRIDKSRCYYNKLNKLILHQYNIKLAKYLMKNQVDVVILYDTLCAECIKILRKNNFKIKIIIDMSAPNALYMDKFYLESIEKNKAVSGKLYEEVNSEDYKNKLVTAKYEIENADYFFVASEFSKKSLMYSNINTDKIFICRYGIDIENQIVTKRHTEKIKIGFIGDVSQKKGFIDFIHIAERLGTDKYEFVVIGKYLEDDVLYKKTKEMLNYKGYLTHDEVLKVCEDMDILIFPSLSDGFGLSVIEAMSKKVLPFVSTNAGVADIIKDAYNGFLFNTSDIEKIISQCEFLQEHRMALSNMQNEAYESVSNLHWEDYDEALKKSLFQIIN